MENESVNKLPHSKGTMTLPVRTLPIAQRWDCHGCDVCCRGSVIPLDDAERKRIAEQHWENDAEMRGVKTVVRQRLFGRRYRLAHRKDESCVFLLPDGGCRIHREHGAEAKPLTCQLFPLQVVPLEQFAYLTARRSCPSAAADRGRPLDEHLREFVKLIEQRPGGLLASTPPPITRRYRGSWKEFLRVTDAIERLMLDQRFPLVRRLVHATQFCDLLEECRLSKMDDAQRTELLQMLEGSAPEVSGEVFRNRTAPKRLAAGFFRQIAVEHVPLHREYVAHKSLGHWWRRLGNAWTIARGRGRVPPLSPAFSPRRFEDLEQPLGPLPEPVMRPLAAYFQTLAASKAYALLGRRRWPVVESFRAAALAYPVALWMLRLTAGDNPPDENQMLAIVGALDRAPGYAPLAGWRHRQRVAAIGRLRQSSPLIAWYAR